MKEICSFMHSISSQYFVIRRLLLFMVGSYELDFMKLDLDHVR